MERTAPKTDDRIAIVGLSALFPKSRNLRDFWDNIVDGRDCIEDVPATHWNVDDYYDEDPSAPDKTYCKRGGFVPPTEFNPLEFGMPPNTLEVTDILQLLSLGVARDVLKDCGAVDAPSWYDPSRTGVVLGITGANSLTQPLATRLQTPVLKRVVQACGLSEDDADGIADTFVKAFAPWEENSFPGMLGNVVAGRIANRFDLGGTNCTLDAACASSLAATRMAIDELLLGRADLMLTGGCDAENTILMYLCFSKTPAFSRRGVIRPFDDEADGTLIGEGIGMLALRRLADAERDGNRIYAVISGLGSSSDGRFKSIYAPRASGQRAALLRAYDAAGVQPHELELLEAHGTGTAVGDLTELTALREVYSESSEERQYAAIGSVKSQIGHTKAAAGAAGLIKLALALHERVLPPTLNVQTPSAAADFSTSPFYVNTTARPWVLDPSRPRRRGAVSAFGFGGTNFHCVLEEAPVSSALRLFRGPRVLSWHAADVAALRTQVESGAAPTDAPIPAESARVVVVVRDERETEDARAKALRLIDGGSSAGSLPGIYFREQAASRRVAALFSGQGSQYVDMARTAVMAFPPMIEALDLASSQNLGGRALHRSVFPPPAFTDAERTAYEDDLRRTEVAQPAIGAISAGQYAVLDALGLQAEGFLGHSFGEVTALWAAGVLDTHDFHRLAGARGRAMAVAAGSGVDPGAMAAVGSDVATAQGLLPGLDQVWVCNDNAPTQVVVGGATDQVAQVVARAAERGIRAQGLPVAAAFHTPYVAAAVEAFRAAVATVPFSPARGTVYSTTAMRRYGTDAGENQELLVGQLAEQVRFREQLEAMYVDGFRIFVEFGPRNVLSQLVKQTLGDDVTVVSLDLGPKGDSERAMKQGLAMLLAHGVSLTDVNRWSAPEPAPEPGRGPTISLNGVNHVSEQRKADFEAALADGYRVAGPAPATPAAAVAVDPVTVASVPVAVEATPAPATTHAATSATTHGIPATELTTELLNIVARLTGYPADMLDPTMHIEADLGIDSIKRVQILGHLRDAFPHAPALAPEDLATVQTLADIVTHLGGTTTTADTVTIASPITPAPATTPAVAVDPATVASVAVGATPAPATTHAATSATTHGIPATELTTELLNIVARLTGYPADMLDPTMHIEADLGIDSIKRVQILGHLRDAFPHAPALAPEDLATVQTLADIVTHLGGTTTTDTTTTADTPAPATTPAVDPATVNTAAAVAVDPVTVASVPVAVAAEHTPLPTPTPPLQEGSLSQGLGRFIVSPRRLPAADRIVWPAPQDRRLVAVVVDGAGVDGGTASYALQQIGFTVYAAALPGVLALPGTHQLASDDEDTVTTLLHHIAAAEGAVDLVLYLNDAPTDWDQAQTRLRSGLLLAKAAQPALEQAVVENGRSAFLTVVRADGADGLRGSTGTATAVMSGISGLAKTLAIESPTVHCRAIDLARGMADHLVAEVVAQEVLDPDSQVVEVGIDRTGARWTAGLRPASVATTTVVGPDDTILVTGGARGVTSACVVALAERVDSSFVLMGRTERRPEPAWAAGVLDVNGLRAAAVAQLRAEGQSPLPRTVDGLVRDVVAVREIDQTIAAVAATGSTVEYLAADVTDAEAVQTALAPLAPRITAIVHGAGALADRLISAKTAEDVDAVLGAKIQGLRNVLDNVHLECQKRVVLFSSVAGLFGNSGQSDYAMANEALTHLAASWDRMCECAVTAISWGAWHGGMVSPELAAMFAARGVQPIPMDVGTRAFADEFLARTTSPTVMIGPDRGLSTTEARVLDRPVSLSRDITHLAESAAIRDHQVAGRSVLPLTFALGMVLNATHQVTRQGVRDARDVTVFSGVVFDESVPQRLQVALEPAGPGLLSAQVVDDETSRPRYGVGTITLRTDDGLSNEHDGHTVASVDPASAVPFGGYEDGTLFHGRSLRGVVGELPAASAELRLLVTVGEHDLPEFATGQYCPLTMDLMLQCGLVWARKVLDQATLPMQVDAVRLLQVPAPGDQLQISVTGHTSPGGTSCDISAHDLDGRPVATLLGVSLVASSHVDATDRDAAALV